jgi:hypothetical protein
MEAMEAVRWKSAVFSMPADGGGWKMAPRDGFEPPTIRLTVERSTTELPGNVGALYQHLSALPTRFHQSFDISGLRSA